MIDDQSGVGGTINWGVQEKIETRGRFYNRSPGMTAEDQGLGELERAIDKG